LPLIELGVLVHLELREANRKGTGIFCYRSEPAERHELGRKNVTVPGLELQLGACVGA
jgi:hypothetical protein